MNQKRIFRLCLAALVVLCSLPTTAGEKGQVYRVYQYVVRSAAGTFDEISQALSGSAAQNGWQVLATVNGGVPENCPFKTQVLVLYDSLYARQIMDANRTTGPFAVLDRVNLFEDEEGIHVSVVNPHSINRTILMDDTLYEALSEQHLQALRGMITAAVQGTVSTDEYGQDRDKGYIGKTMGVMAGGPFNEKLQDQAEVAGGGWQEVAAKVGEAMNQAGEKWGMQRVFQLSLPAYRTVVIGTTGLPMSAKSFDIVKAGSDKSRKKLECPGLAHAAAYPIEVVVTEEEGAVKVRLVNVMFRMKMYFQDAGNWAFMKNMGMPGSIQSEIEDQIKIALGTK